MKLLGPFPRKVELAILGIVTLVCANSAYQLFLAAPSNPAVNAASRGPAGVVGRGESFQIIDLGCLKDGMRFPVPSDRARLKGSWCATALAVHPTPAVQWKIPTHITGLVHFENWPRHYGLHPWRLALLRSCSTSPTAIASSVSSRSQFKELIEN